VLVSRDIVTPSVVIELRVEAAPCVRLCCANSSEESRVMDWIGAHEGLAELVRRAVELAEEARAA